MVQLVEMVGGPSDGAIWPYQGAVVEHQILPPDAAERAYAFLLGEDSPPPQTRVAIYRYDGRVYRWVGDRDP